MKKRVRIYKATNGEGQFINKTAQFLKKAQEGGMPDPNEMGYPGSQQQTAQVTDDQLASFVLNEIGTSAPRESIVVKLVNAYGKEPMEAVQFVDKMYKYVEQKQQEEIDSAQEEDADTEEITSGDDVANEMPVEEEVRQTPTGTQMSNEIVDEWDSEGDDDDSEAAANLIMQYGGYYRAQDGSEVPIEMPDLSAYLPQNISDYYGNSDLVSQMAYPELEEDTEEGTEEYQGFEAPDMPEDVDFDVARHGGSKKSKKQFVNSVLNLVKKQMGGPNEDTKSSDSDADPTGSSVRKQNLDKFINSVKNESTMATAKKQAEEHYDQMMQQQQMPPQDDVMRRGGPAGSRDPKVVRGNALRYRASQLKDFLSGRNRRDRRDRDDEMSYNNNNSYLPSNSKNIYDDKIDYNSDGYSDATDYAFFEQKNQRENNENNRQPNYRLDVRKSNWLTGRPSKYSIEYYGQSPMPGMGSRNQGTGMYTLDGKIYRWPATRKKVEIDAASVNKDAIKEVATATPDSKATTNAAETDVKSTTSTSTQGTIAADVKAGDTKETVTTTKNGRTTVVPTNYGTIDPSKMKRSDTAADNVLTKYLNTKPVTPKAPVVKQRDSWGRPLGDKFYGYNPKTGKYEQGKVEKNWKTKSGNEAKSFEGTYTTDWGTVKPATYQIIKDKNGKIIPEKSFAAVTQSEDYGGVIYVPWNELPNRNSDEGEDWNSGAGGDMLENKYGGSINYEIGGSVKDPFMDPYGNLQQFIDGGDEDFTQADLDDTYSKDTANGDFQMAKYGASIDFSYQKGGVKNAIQNNYPGNITGSSKTYRNEIQRVYDPKTGKTIAMPANMGNLSKVEVNKTRFWSGKPKKYTMYFNGQPGQAQPGQAAQPAQSAVSDNKNMDPAAQAGRDRYCLDFPNSPRCQGVKPNADVNQSDANQRSNTDDLSLKAKMAINKGERSAERNSRRLERRGLDEYGNPIGESNEGAIYNDGELKKDREGNWFDRNKSKIPDKKRPSEVPDYYNSNQKTANEPMSNAEMLTGQGKVWDEKTQNWIMKPQMRFGGDLEIFIPRAEDGFQTPLSPGECPMGSTKNAAGDCVDFTGKVVKKRSTGSDFGSASTDTKIPGVMDETYKNPLTGEKPGVIKDESGELKINEADPTLKEETPKATPPADNMYAVEVENKKDRGKLTWGKNTEKNEAILGAVNSGIDYADSISKTLENNKEQAKMQDELSSDNLFASKSTVDKGDYDTNSGLFRPDEMGQNRDGRSKKYGGNIYQDGGYVEGDEVFMTDEEIQEFLANGGDLEFI